MKRNSARALFTALSFGLLTITASASNPAGIHPSVIYGDDDRKDVYETDNALFRDLAQSTVALFFKIDVTDDPSKGTSRLTTENFGDSFRLCKDEPFRDQPSGAFCSGSLVGENLIMTAGHCIRSASACANVRFVFGFAQRQKGLIPEDVPTDDVYGCTQIVARQENGDGADFALVKTDRPVKKYRPLQINRTGRIEKGAPIVVIGHPSGIPTKISDGADVRDPDPNGYFVANLDTYGGNSGSAVVNTRTGLVEGVLVRGEQDFVARGSCYVSNRCANDGCRGEDVTKISALSDKIP